MAGFYLYKIRGEGEAWEGTPTPWPVLHCTMIPGVVAMQQLFRSHPFDVGCPHARHKHSAKVLPPGRCVILSSAREAWGVPMILNRREGTGVGITQPEGMYLDFRGLAPCIASGQ